MFVEEERSADREMGHIKELVGYAVFEGLSDAEETVTKSDDRSADDRRVVGYYTSWSRYDRGYMPDDVPLEKITHLNYAFLNVEADGTVMYADAWGDPRNLERFRERKQRHPETRMLLSVGGATLSENFSDAASTADR